jgi:hypothetical protein
MSQSDSIKIKFNDLTSEEKEKILPEYVLIPREEVIDILKNLEGLKRKVQAHVVIK